MRFEKRVCGLRILTAAAAPAGGFVPWLEPLLLGIVNVGVLPPDLVDRFHDL